MEACAPALVGVIAFATGCFVAGLYFAGLDAIPSDKCGITVTIMQRIVGLILLIVAFIFFFCTPLQPAALSINFGALFGMFAFIWWMFSGTVTKGGDFKPLAWFTLATCVILAAAFAVSYTRLAAVPELHGMMIDFAILMWWVVLMGIFFFLGMKGIWGRGVKVGGYVFFLLGIYSFGLAWKYMMLWTVTPVLGG
jgi:hypothetical protein